MKRNILLTLTLLLTLGTQAEDEWAEGFLTEKLNAAIEKQVPNDSKVSAPVFGGWIAGKYGYNDQWGTHGGDGFNCRFARAYVSGSILNDFKYRLQMELCNTPAIRDLHIQWAHWKEFSVKFGQFKRPFTFGNPLHPWDIGTTSYNQIVTKFAGFGDYCGESNVNGRDIGLAFEGSLFPVGKDQHRLLTYSAGIFNGNGINHADNNGRKDLIGTLKVQPLEGFFLGISGWKGDFRSNNVTVGRNRWALSASYDAQGWTARAEYAHHTGHKVSDWNTTTQTWKGTARADGWYTMLGVPCTKWLKTFVSYDAFRDQGTWGTLKSVYAICPNFRLHKDLLFQVQYNFVCDKNAPRDRHYNELVAQAYIRF